MIVEMQEVKRHLDRWQDVLRLRDWDIQVEIVETPWRKSADIKIDLDDRKAVMLINRSPRSENLEELVVHELLHIKLYGMDQMLVQLLDAVFGCDENDVKREFAITQFMLLLEPTVEDLTKGFLAAGGERQPLSFGRLRPEIDSELGR